MNRNSLFESYLNYDESNYDEALRWIRVEQQSCEAIVSVTGLNSVLDGSWIQQSNGNIAHKSGGFFSVIGLEVRTDQRESGKGWKQPMVDQGTESSIAGFMVSFDGSECFCLTEAKFEPGNYGKVLISPSLQVTYSNFFQAHGGKKPRFSEYFDGSMDEVEVLYSKWMPEDGGRFYLKRVKYMLVKVENKESIPIPDNFRWLEIRVLKRLLHVDNIVNPHVRSLLALF